MALHVPSLWASSLWAGVRENSLPHLHLQPIRACRLRFTTKWFHTMWRIWNNSYLNIFHKFIFHNSYFDFIQSVTLTTASQKDYYKNFNIHLKYCLSALVIVFTSHSQSSSARPICETFFLSIHWSKRFWTLDPTPTILYRPWSVIPGIINKKMHRITWELTVVTVKVV